MEAKKRRQTTWSEVVTDFFLEVPCHTSFCGCHTNNSIFDVFIHVVFVFGVCVGYSCFECVFTGKRRYDRKQSGYGGQTKPIFHKKVTCRSSSIKYARYILFLKIKFLQIPGKCSVKLTAREILFPNVVI